MGYRKGRWSFPAASPLICAKMARPRVLIIDDEAHIGSALKRLLSELDVIALDDPERAFGLLEQDQAFDALIVDLMMPRLSGPELVSRLPERLAQRVVFITGSPTSDLAEQVRALKTAPLLEKPFDISALRDALKRVGLALPPRED